ncbi:hypothetical protein [Pasteurella multocida]|uniref:hypothetical protein n=1 Tax=Pasteurella multocida TaxID=747 RepID=UPI0039786664
MKKAFKYLLALPFIVLWIIFVILWLLFEALMILSVYAVSFFQTLKYFIAFGKWEWSEIKDETFSHFGKF